MADKKKIGDDLMADLKKSFSTKNDILQYLMKTVPGPKLKKVVASKTEPKNEFQLLSAELKASVAKKPVKKPNAKVESSSKEYRPSKATKAKNFNLGVSKGGVSFKEAFAHFRKKGAKTFTWNGKKYTTELKKK
jgi:hypothetical protein